MKSLAADVPHSPPIIIPYTNEEKCHFDTAVRYVRIHMYVRTNIDVRIKFLAVDVHHSPPIIIS